MSWPESRIAVPATLSGAAAPGKRKNACRSTIYARFCVIPGCWPRWAVSWPESRIAVPATLVSGLGCFLRACCSVCDDERSPEATPRDLYLDIVCLYIIWSRKWDHDTDG